MRVATKQRKRTVDEAGLDVGISYNWLNKYVYVLSFPGMKNWEKINSEAKKIKIDKALFADDSWKEERNGRRIKNSEGSNDKI